MPALMSREIFIKEKKDDLETLVETCKSTAGSMCPKANLSVDAYLPGGNDGAQRSHGSYQYSASLGAFTGML